MDQAEYRAAIQAVGDAIRKANADPRSVVGLLGKRIKGTDLFELRPDDATVGPLVALRSAGVGSGVIAAARVLPGGQVVEPLACLAGDSWGPVPKAREIAKANILRLSLPGDLSTAESWASAIQWFSSALAHNESQIARLRKRGAGEDSVFLPCLMLYDDYVATHGGSRLARLTDHLLGARLETEGVIAIRSRNRHGDSSSNAMSIVNSLRRSAGTNYQGLVALAIAEELRAEHSVWYVHYPPPREYMQRLALRFTPKPGLEVEIDPDIDILLKNAAWVPGSRLDEPVVLLSVKTRLADRAGAAARWKMYFDVATHSCPFDGKIDGCAWHEQGLRFAKPDLAVRLQHCIVTANIYKVSSDQRFADLGELGTAQTKANTFMFDRRYATRLGDKVEMEGWEPLTALPGLLRSLSEDQSLPF